MLTKSENKPVKVENKELHFWEPLTAFTRMRETMDQMFTDLFHRFGAPERAISFADWTPYMDLYKSGDKLIAEVNLPGLTAKDIDVQATRDQLTIKGEYKREESKKIDGAFHTEREYGSFHRIMALPYAIKSEGIEAKLENGVLKIAMPLEQPEVHKATSVKVH